MKKILLNSICFFITISSFCQTVKDSSTYNFDFEKTAENKFAYWNNFGSNDYVIAIDSVVKHSGNYAASISNPNAVVDFKALSYTLPGNFKGKKLTISGYIKTENVTDGYAGLWLRIDPKIAFNNMENVGIKGTADWKKYEVTVNMDPANTKAIVLGGLLVGKGKMWLDDLSVTIDGKDVGTLTPIPKKAYAADSDKGFGNASKIDSIVLNETNTENLKMLGLIWGFVKYYHPKVAVGNFNFDNELFRITPQILASKTNSERDIAFVKWIKNLGEFEIATDLKIKGELNMLPDLDWIEKSDLSSDLKMILNNIKNAKRENEHYYIGLYEGVNNPEFKNEKAYAELKYPDVGFRLLCLYRYWNMIQYYFPYKHLIEGDWKNILQKYIPTFLQAKNELDYKLAALALIAEIHDTHANIWGNDATIKNFRGTRYSALDLTFVEKKAVVSGYHNDSLAKETGLKIGDIITSINSKPVDDIIKNILKYTPASNYPTQLRDIAPNLLRTNDSVLVVQYISDGVEKTIDVKTYPSVKIKMANKFQKKDTCFKFIDKDIAYLYLGSIKEKYLPTIMKDIENTKGLIIDLRSYPSEFVVYSLGKYLMPQKTDFVKFAVGNIKTPGLFTIGKQLNVLGKKSTFYRGKIVILINETTQSQAEFTTMAFRVAPNATVIGSTTAGADGNVSQIYLPGSISTMISGINVLYPNGKETQRIGIVPDIEITPTIEAIKQGKDEVLLKAIELIKN
jgi:C-terminal processing protease CtpA/Prc